MDENEIDIKQGIVPTQSYDGEILESVPPFDEKKLLRRIDILYSLPVPNTVAI